MKKEEIIQIGKIQYNQDSKTINQVLEFVLNMDKKEVFLVSEVGDEISERIIQIFEKLSSGYPLAYIINRVNFAGYDFYVDENVLVPRDDTEIVVSAVIDYKSFVIPAEAGIYSKGKHVEVNEGTEDDTINNNEFLDSGSSQEGQLNEKKKLNVKGYNKQVILIDIGTGSGIIPISILKSDKIDIEKCIALELSKKAFLVAEKNIIKHNLRDKIRLINTDFRQYDFGQFEGKELVITANLPYIKDKDFKNMDLGVYTFEPEMALYGGKNTGFELYEELVNLLLDCKNKFMSLSLFIEIGFDQHEVSKSFLSGKGLKFEYFKDTNNIYRVIEINF